MINLHLSSAVFCISFCRCFSPKHILISKFSLFICIYMRGRCKNLIGSLHGTYTSCIWWSRTRRSWRSRPLYAWCSRSPKLTFKYVVPASITIILNQIRNKNLDFNYFKPFFFLDVQAGLSTYVSAPGIVQQISSLQSDLMTLQSDLENSLPEDRSRCINEL